MYDVVGNLKSGVSGAGMTLNISGRHVWVVNSCGTNIYVRIAPGKKKSRAGREDILGGIDYTADVLISCSCPIIIFVYDIRVA